MVCVCVCVCVCACVCVMCDARREIGLATKKGRRSKGRDEDRDAGDKRR